MGYILNGIKTGGVPVDFVEEIIKSTKIPIFIESGTAGGESVRSVAHLFRECHTIELIQGKFNINENDSNINAYIGNSSDVIREILKKISSDDFILFWLDAHYSDSEPSEDGVIECPLIEELKEISVHQKSIILIDDARLFLGSPPYPLNPQKWTKIQEIFYECKNLFPYHYTTIMDDYILCYHNDVYGAVESEWRRRYDIRYPCEETLFKKSIQVAFDILKKYIEDNKLWK